MPARLSHFYLIYVGLFWSLYGLANIIYPQILTHVALLGQQHWVAAAEVRAMYGGAEFAIGVFTLIGLSRNGDYKKPAILLNALLLSGLAVTRIIGLLIDGPDASVFAVSFSLTQIPPSYNSGALWFFELPFALLGWYLFFKSNGEQK